MRKPYISNLYRCSLCFCFSFVAAWYRRRLSPTPSCSHWSTSHPFTLYIATKVWF